MKEIYIFTIKKIQNVLLIGTIIGFIAGFTVSLFYITSNKYFQFKMFRILLITLKDFLNGHVMFFVSSALVISVLLFATVRVMKVQKKKAIQFGLIFFGFLIPIVYVDWFYVTYKFSFLWDSRKIAARIGDFLTGEIALNHFLNLGVKHIFIILVLLLNVTGLIVIWKIISKLDWKKTTEIFSMKRGRRIALVILVFLFFLNAGAFLDRNLSHLEEPNVFLIVCETLRADHLGLYGYFRNTSENIDEFAGNATIFKNAYAQAPLTMPSMWNIVTSKYQSEVPAKYEYVTIAEYFKSKNYKTAAFISQHHLEGTKHNLHQGFDLYDSRCAKDVHGMSAKNATSVTDTAIKWIGKKRNHPIFAWLVYFDPHDPYKAPDSFRAIYNNGENFSGDRRAEGIQFKVSNENIPSEEHKQFLINAYDEEIRYFDFEVGRLLSFLKRSDQYDNSIIIFTSDHGEELGDNGNRWDHGQLLSQEEIHIPLLIKMPGQEMKIEVKQAVQNIDLYPTLVDYFEESRTPRFYSSLEGKSLMPLFRRGKLGDERFAVSLWLEQKCIVMGNYKYWIQDGKEYLTHVVTKDSISDPEIRNKLRNQLDRIYKQLPRKKDYYKTTVEKLKSLGYLH